MAARGVAGIAKREHGQDRARAGVIPRKSHRHYLLLACLLLALLAASGVFVHEEFQSARLQSWFLSRYASQLQFQLVPGASRAIHFPAAGPFDKRLGYAELPVFLERLEARDFIVAAQARQSPALLRYTERGLFAPYAQKSQAGLYIEDCLGQPLYQFRYPQQGYRQFRDIPPVVVQSLLFVENRDLLSAESPYANPAVDWQRFAVAGSMHIGKMLGLREESAGGSTLATQIEKFRHAPDGITYGVGDKLRQMASASVRAYAQGRETEAARQDIVRDYLNDVPLSAAPGHGEVHGLADGLALWFGANFARVNAVLADPGAALKERGLALRQVMALIIAQRRPSYYLGAGRSDLAELTDSYLRLLAGSGIITLPLRDAAIAQTLSFRNYQAQPALQPVQASKGISLARRHLAELLGDSLYDLDRRDLSASTSLNGALQSAASDYLRALADPEKARELGLIGERLLAASNTGKVRYSFTLLETTLDAFRVRVQTDNTDQPFDLNESSKLELGSTAKLRVLTTYLEIVNELHARYAHISAEELRAVTLLPQDVLSRWAVSYLAEAKDRSLPLMLEAALERRYSASPGEAFFTGGGRHVFSNFKRADNGRMPTVREALRESINLPFVRVLRDVVRYTIYRPDSDRALLLKDDSDPRREDYLRRFADREGKVYLQRFWRKYQGKNSDERLQTFWDGLKPGAVRLAAVHRYLLPDRSLAEFTDFLRARVPNEERLGDKRIAELYQRYGPEKFNLPDQGYIARVHPLELWLLSFLMEHPDASLADVFTASEDVRQEVYGWLFKSRHKRARDNRIAIMLEVEAFADIHQRWQRLGYPFDHLVPSLATALGSSGDRPAALAELIGIIQNDGVRLPVLRIDALHFAANTPYETELVRAPAAPVRVLPSPVAGALRSALSQVVEAGTARRLNGSFQHADGSPIVLGGKTGTGDNRIETVSASGQVRSSRLLNRTATFVFYLGERYFGTLTAFVPGENAQGLRFTSALPVQVLKGMAPLLEPYLETNAVQTCLASREKTELRVAGTAAPASE